MLSVYLQFAARLLWVRGAGGREGAEGAEGRPGERGVKSRPESFTANLAQSCINIHICAWKLDFQTDDARRRAARTERRRGGANIV